MAAADDLELMQYADGELDERPTAELETRLANDPDHALGRAKVEALGLDFHTADGRPYWWEAACYAFTAAEIDVIEEGTEALHRLLDSYVGLN